ncbi:MAG TPA: hypothetical protein VJ276_02930 [Thermoanaerobaculia bacterium]|nr:hypothetical protein [Thermoanaerobaculia bacterium]
MRKALFFVAVVVLLGSLSAHAQGVSCNACQYYDFNYSACAPWMGRFANCYTYCDSIACNCLAGAHGGRCTQDGDGGWTWKTYNNIRLVDPTVPFEMAYSVVSVRVTPPGAEVRRVVLMRRRTPRA